MSCKCIIKLNSNKIGSYSKLWVCIQVTPLGRAATSLASVVETLLTKMVLSPKGKSLWKLKEGHSHTKLPPK